MSLSCLCIEFTLPVFLTIFLAASSWPETHEVTLVPTCLAWDTALTMVLLMDSSRSMSGVWEVSIVWLACKVADSKTSRADAIALSAADSSSENVFRRDPWAATITLFNSGSSSTGPGGDRPCMGNSVYRHEDVDSSLNVMAQGDAREGKWKGNWQMD